MKLRKVLFFAVCLLLLIPSVKASSKLTLSSDYFAVDNVNKVISGALLTNRASDIENLVDTNIGIIQVVDENENQVNDDDVLKTGDKVRVIDNGVIDEYMLSVIGDVNGDGTIDVSDLLLMKSHCLGNSLNEEELLSADVNNNDEVNNDDVLRERNHILRGNIIFNQGIDPIAKDEAGPVISTNIGEDKTYELNDKLSFDLNLNDILGTVDIKDLAVYLKIGDEKKRISDVSLDLNGNKRKTYTYAYAFERGDIGNIQIIIDGTVIDSHGNTLTLPYTIDTTLKANALSEKIVLNGDNPTSMDVGTTYVDPGYGVFDAHNEEVSDYDMRLTSNINPNIVGTYTVIYTLYDENGQAVTSKNRTVNVVDTKDPSISINYSNDGNYTYNAATNEITAEVNTIISLPSAIANDNYDGTVTVTKTSNIKMNSIGNYTVTYTATDNSGNVGTKNVIVHIVDTTAPTIRVDYVDNNGYSYNAVNNELSVEINSSLTIPTATMIDNYDSNKAITGTSNVNSAVAGDYTITYSASDASSNKTIKNVTVHVIDSTKPVITIIGKSYIQHEVGTSYSDEGATATDNSLESVNITPSGTVDIHALGIYTITYKACDSHNNCSTKSRTVEVVDTTVPLITLIGTNATTVEVGSSYDDQGVTVTDNYDTGLTATVTSDVNPDVIGSYKVRYNVSDSSGNEAHELTRIVNVVDTTPPVITINGDAQVVINYTAGLTYTDAGATAVDNSSEAITVHTDESEVNMADLGAYLVYYNACDSSNNCSYKARSVLVKDIEAPTITINGDVLTTIEAATTYTDTGATAVDNYDASIKVNTISNNVNTMATGNYEVAYSATDTSNNTGTIKRRVKVVDTTAPVITLNGNSTVDTNLGGTYSDQGAIATDTLDGNITNKIVTTSNVNTNIVGTYMVKYNVTDANGNVASEIVRMVNVVDKTPPVITLNGSNPQNVTYGSTYSDPGATAMDAYDGSVEVNITSSNVNTNSIGSYETLYKACDNSGNCTTTTRMVNVTDSTAPTITLNGSNPTTIEVKSTYTDEGAAASDAVDGNVSTTIISNNLNNKVVGSYSITYKACDSTNNCAIATRTVNVVDTTAPVITLNGNSNTIVAQGSNYVDAGATASDNYDGNITSSIVNAGSVNTSVLGEYKITYNVSDSNGNKALEVTRTVTVVDQTKPVITLLGNSTVNVSYGGNYTDAGATALDNTDGDISNKIVVTSNVNTKVAGIYYVYYDVSDAAGNKANKITRTVVVANISEEYKYNYTGTVQTFTPLFDGYYVLQVWGAQGGNGYATTGGQGGYSTGKVYLNKGQTIYIYVGGKGNTSAGGYNGGGAGGIDVVSGQNAGGGGGASDVRINGTSLSNRVIVAGGGAGGGRDGTTGVGGGTSGTASANYSTGYAGGTGTQVSGGLAYTTSRGATNGSFGQGGQGSTGYNAAGGGGGGGGYYGGAGGTSTLDHGSGFSAGGGGGSGYIGGVTNGVTIPGNASMPNPSGGTETGQSGNGYAIIYYDYKYDYGYTGSVQTFTANSSGIYQLEVWGAQGGTSDTLAGGRGGYSTGQVYLSKGTTLYVYVGSQGFSSTSNDWVTLNGGWNGGGGTRRYGPYAASGGGATDITFVSSSVSLDGYYRYVRSSASYLSRLIVAGGGGGARSGQSTVEGYGGGATGGGTSGYSNGILESRADSINVQTGGPGTQTSGGNAEIYPSPDYVSYAGYSAPGSFGQGGTYYSAHTSNTAAGGGGGGWYGGGVNCHSNGGGGSGFIWTAATASNVPSGYSVSSSYYLSKASTVAGNASMPSTDGLTETGHNGNGYARISLISLN